MNNVEEAIKLAVRVHANQVDKGGAPYILHPLRLMLRMDNEIEMIVAVLHDVVEDGDCGLHDLRVAGFPEAAVQAVECLTRREGEDYEAFVGRVATNAIATKVKIADLEDNMNLSRIQQLAPKDFERLAKYHRALYMLKQGL